MKKQLLFLFACSIAICSISSCAKCYVCTGKDSDGYKYKHKVCSTDPDFKDNIDDQIRYLESSGEKCRATNEAI